MERKRKMSKEIYVPISLPSRCLVYDGVDKEKIKIRPFKGKDAQLIAELSLGNVKKKFLEIIKNVLQGVEASKLTVGDAQHVMLWEAINSYDREHGLSIVCESCLKKIDVVVDLRKINSVELPEDYAEPVEKKWSTGTVQLRLETLADEIAALERAKDGQSTYLYSLARTIVSEKDIIVLEKQLEEVSTKDLNVIESFHDEFQHGPDMIASYTCLLCDYEGKLEVPFQIERLFSFKRQS